MRTGATMIIPFFIAYQGCPHRCIFCNIQKIAGKSPERITEETFGERIHTYLEHAKRKGTRVQIAFYGGNFTGLAEEAQCKLLGFARLYMQKGLIQDIRISTRPDNINDDCLSLLKKFGVSTVEIGAQSLDDEVLKKIRRGHSAADVKRALQMLRDRNFKTGIHLMVGLPGDSPSGFFRTIDDTVTLRPDMVRIHPTLVFENTDLATLYRSGDYRPLTLSEAIDLSKYALKKCEEADIPIIRLGLQTNREMEIEGSVIAGPFHPAFRSLVEESIFLDMAQSLLSDTETGKNREVTFFLSPRDVSFFRGQKNRNIDVLKIRHQISTTTVKIDPAQERGTLVMAVNGRIKKIKRFGRPENEGKR